MNTTSAGTARPPVSDLILLGGAGALARDKLLPALLELTATGELPPASPIIAVDRAPLDRDSFRERVRAWLHVATAGRRNRHVATAWLALRAGLDYLPGDL